MTHSYIWNIFYHNSACTDHTVLPDLDTLPYYGIGSYKSSLSHCHISTQYGSRANMHKITHFTFVLDDATGITDNSMADLRKCIDRNIGTDHYPIISQYGPGINCCGRMNGIHRQATTCSKILIYFLSNGIISYCNKEFIIL